MGRQLHKLRNKELYAIYSTVADDYITEFLPKDQIKEIWLNDLIANAKKKVEEYMNEVDYIVTEKEIKEVYGGKE